MAYCRLNQRLPRLPSVLTQIRLLVRGTLMETGSGSNLSHEDRRHAGQLGQDRELLRALVDRMEDGWART